MKQNHESITPLRKYIAIGYAVIALLIGGIVFIYLSEWRDLDRIEAESKEANLLRQKVHDAYAQMLDLTLYGEKVFLHRSLRQKKRARKGKTRKYIPNILTIHNYTLSLFKDEEERNPSITNSVPAPYQVH